MRPAVQASILRNRTQIPRRMRGRPHTFSLNRLLMLVLIGAIFFIPGLALTVIGVQKYSGVYDLPEGQKVMFKGIGPAMCTFGVGLLVGAGIYYCCYGLGEGLGSRALAASHEGSMISNESRPGKQSSLLDHQENGNSPMGTPDVKDKKHHRHHRHHHHYHHHPQQRVVFNEESVPLASCENISDINNLTPQPPVSIVVEEPSDTRPSPSDDVSEHVINGDIRAPSPESYQS
ncbi:uncharacterized protein LOC121378191 [Gigantopelta aegis]|uniref:uncharacterized protein LOC121378191 n=1 Tax=Gigantopelta aegis TaxID=1735272 RepID=UPI001B8886BD|nr:uncharacterized protein LOC121378191 [Gigantopelta aegis]